MKLTRATAAFTVSNLVMSPQAFLQPSKLGVLGKVWDEVGP